MPSDPNVLAATNWRSELPTLAARLVSLREPRRADMPAILRVLSLSDATKFGIDEPITEGTVERFIDRVSAERAQGVSFTYAIARLADGSLVGLLQVRQLDPVFEAAEWECTLLPLVRGTGVFVDAARVAGSFAFGVVGAHRLEARVLLLNGRGNGALRKLGAVQEGVLRRAVRVAGEYLDQVLWSILRDDWGEHWVPTSPRVH